MTGQSRGVHVAVLVVALALFLVCWAALHRGPLSHGQIKDTPVYERYGDLMASGSVPYRDFRLEYPPAALPLFVLPSLGHHGSSSRYDKLFDAIEAVCGCVALVAVWLALLALRASTRRLAAALALVAVAPVLIGTVVLSRYDLWPAALAALGLAALLHRRNGWAALALGTAVAAKLWPAALLPLAAVWLWRRDGRRVATGWAADVVIVVGAWFLPFAVVSPGGVGWSLHEQLSRPLQLESLGSALVLAAHQLGAVDVHTYTSHGSQNLAGGPGWIGAASFALQLAAVVALWVAFARGEPDPERLVRYAAAVVAALVAFSKVFSPQFVIWLVPLVPLVCGARGVVAGVLLAAALVLTQSWFPQHYWQLANDLAPTQSWLLLARDLVVVALFVALAVTPGRRRASPRAAPPPGASRADPCATPYAGT